MGVTQDMPPVIGVTYDTSIKKTGFYEQDI